MSQSSSAGSSESVSPPSEQDDYDDSQASSLLPSSLLTVPSDSASVASQLASLAAHLRSTSSNWKLRVAAVRRLQSITPTAIRLSHSSFLEFLYSERSVLISQLSDRRSSVVKFTAAAVDDISSLVAQSLHSASSPAPSSIRHFLLWSLHLIESLLPISIVTIRVISESVIQTVMTITRNAAPFAAEAATTSDVDLFGTLIRGCSNKHSTAREVSFNGLALAMEFANSDLVKREQNADQEESAKIQAANEEKEKKEREGGAVSSSPDSGVSSSRPGSALLSSIETCISTGVSDSNVKTRSAARVALIQFKSLSSSRQQRILLSLPPSNRKMYEKQLVDELVEEGENGASSPNKAQSPSQSGPSSPPNSSLKAIKSKFKRSSFGPDSVNSGNIDEITVAVPKTLPTSPQKGDNADSESEAVVSAESEAEKRAEYTRHYTLLSKLLDLDTPTLTDKMLDYLMHQGVMEVLVEFVARVPRSFDFTDIARNDESITAAQRSAIKQRRAAPETEDEKLHTRRSFNVMQILSGPRQAQSIFTVISDRMGQIILRLLATFHPQSEGNFYHACAILTKLVGMFPAAVLDCCNSKNGKLLFLRCFERLHEPPVPDFILTLLTANAEKPKKNAVFTQLKKHNILDSLTERLVSSGEDQVYATAAADFLLQYIDKVSSAEYLTAFLSDIAKANGTVERLVAAISGPDHKTLPAWQRKQCTNVLFDILTATEQRTISISDASNPMAAQMNPFASKEVPNPMFGMRGVVFGALKSKIAELSAALLEEGQDKEFNAAEIKFSSYKVSSPFSQARLALFRLISKVCLVYPASVKLVPHELWRVLIDWFFVYVHSSFYLLSFRDLFMCVLRQGFNEITKLILEDFGFMQKMIDAYRQGSPCTRDSFILEICNHLRLTASPLKETEFLPSLLARHAGWKQFLPKLRAESERQSKTFCPRPPMNPEQAYQRAMMGMPDKGAEEKKYGPGIEIGSLFAYRLGYEVHSKADKTEAKSGPAAIAAALAAASSNAAAGSGAAKKKKKKNKKKKKSGESKSGEDKDDEESGDDEDEAQ